VALLDDDAPQAGQHDLDPAALVDPAARTVHVVERTLVRSMEGANLPSLRPSLRRR
jgi:hypothetical protein